MLSTIFDLISQVFESAHALLIWFIHLLWPPTVVLEGGRSVILKRQLAEGGFGYVFLAQDSRSGDSFAIKKMLCQSDEQVRPTN